MTRRDRPPFRADHVGSFLRPKFLLDAREQAAKGEITPAQLREAWVPERGEVYLHREETCADVEQARGMLKDQPGAWLAPI